jgi:hypothetical protein
MINEENLNKLYNGVLEGTELTTKQLNGYGLNSKDLNELIQEGSIERLKRGLYSLKSVDELFYYGKKLIYEKEYEKATLCFEKCFELDPTHLGACFQLFLRSIQKEDYQRTFELYENLFQSENEFYNVDANYYLYLLSIITEVPEKHREYARYLKIDDIKIPFTDQRYKDIPLQNQVRSTTMQRKFSYALKQLNDLIFKHGNLTVQDIITRTLLHQAINAEKISKNTIASLINQKKYNEVIEHLLDKQCRHNLSVSEEYILKLSKKIIEIQESSKIPERRTVQAETLFEAIDTDNYNIALRLSTEYNEKNNISNDSNAINILLNDICALINSLSKPKQTEVKENKPIEISNNKTYPATTFSSIISYLMKNDLDNAFYSLRSYMETIEKTEFEFLIIDLIKISLLEKDIAFTKPMIALTLISQENYTFDISSYIQEFYITLSQNKFEESRIYLDIISKANKLGQDCIITDGLYQVLESSEKALNYKRDNTVLAQADRKIEDIKTQSIKYNPTTVYSQAETEVVEPLVQEQPVSPAIESSAFVANIKTNKSEITQAKRDSEKEFIDKKYEELVERKGIILLRPMDEARINRIFDMVDEYPDMVAFVIGDGNRQQVVLRYKPITEEYVDVKDLINFGNESYKNGNYNDCIGAYLQLLQLFKEPRANIYSKLGLAFMKNFNIPLAIDYLTIATGLAKKENVGTDFSDLISRLRGDISQEDVKPRFRMNQEDFDYGSINNFYGIENFDEINAYIIDSGLDVESACQQINMTSEQIDIIRLIYAREFYAKWNFEKGDLFLNSVEKSKNKTKETKKLFEEIRRNKRFYQNRQVEETRQLVLSLMPKKK